MWLLIQIGGSAGLLWAWCVGMIAFWRGWRDEPSISHDVDFDRGPIAVRRTFAVGQFEWLPLVQPSRGGFIPVRFVNATKALFVTGESIRLRGSLEWSNQTVTVTIRHSWRCVFTRAILLGMVCGVAAIVAGAAQERGEADSTSVLTELLAVVIGVAIVVLSAQRERVAGLRALTDLAARFRKDAA